MIVVVIMSIILAIIGIVGYSFEPPPGYVGDYRVMCSMLVYYSFLTMYVFSYLLCDLISCGFELELKEIFMAMILFITMYGLRYLRRAWEFKLKRTVDILTYGSVIYLMDIHIKITSSILVPILLTISLWLAILLAYTFVEFCKIKELITFEDFQLVYVVYVTTFLLGISENMESISFIVLMALNTYALYVIIFRYVRPLMELGKR